MKVKVTIDKAKLEELLQTATERIKKGVRSGLEAFLIDLQGRITGTKLSGQVLQVRTGTLWRSIQYAVEETPIGYRGSIGSNLIYAAIHEFGGDVFRPDHVRISKEGTVHFVRGHTAHYPERSYLRSSLQEELPEFPATMKEQIVRALEENA